MPGNIHERLVLLFAEFPRLLEKLMALIDPTREWHIAKLADSTVRTGAAIELHPDLLFADGTEGPWTATEIQRSVDHGKDSSWPLMITLKNHQRKCSGDIIVITHSAAVAAWARQLTAATGPLGTRVQCSLVVVHLDSMLCEMLLASNEPIASVVAAWAVHENDSPQAVAIAARAVRNLVSPTLAANSVGSTPSYQSPQHTLDDHALRERMVRAILSFLTPSVFDKVLAAMAQDRDDKEQIDERKTSRFDEWLADIQAKGKAESEAKGKADGLRDALRAVIKTRGFSLTKRANAQIDTCTDLATLQTWHSNAVTARTVSAIFRN